MKALIAILILASLSVHAQDSARYKSKSIYAAQEMSAANDKAKNESIRVRAQGVKRKKK